MLSFYAEFFPLTAVVCLCFSVRDEETGGFFQVLALGGLLAYRLLALLECLSNMKKLLMAACYLIDSPFHVVSSFLLPLFVLLSVSFVHT